jgi:hypothetical protein
MQQLLLLVCVCFLHENRMTKHSDGSWWVLIRIIYTENERVPLSVLLSVKNFLLSRLN